MLIPTFYVFQGAKFTDTIVVASAAYYVFVSMFCKQRSPSALCLSPFNGEVLGTIKWISRLYSNQGNLFYAPRPFEWGEQIVVITGGRSRPQCVMADTGLYMRRLLWYR
jgi:hypothetical protein